MTSATPASAAPSAARRKKTLLTLAQETRAIGSFNEFAVAADLAVSLGKQSGGWRQGAARKARPEAAARDEP